VKRNNQQKNVSLKQRSVTIKPLYMDRLHFIFYLSILYDILSVWGVVQAVLLRLHWLFLVLLVILLIVFPPLGFGLTMFVKYRIRKKKPGPRKRKRNTEKNPENYLENLTGINSSPQ